MLSLFARPTVLRGALLLSRPAAAATVHAVTHRSSSSKASQASSTGSSAGSEADVPTPEEVFRLIDTDGSGTLSKEEFLVACQKMAVSDLVQLRMSLARSELSRTRSADQVTGTTARTIASLWMERFVTTLEVAVSKIFPAGFGWQLASVYAVGAGLAPTDIGFAVATGLGDFSGVCLGHTVYMIGKKAVTGDSSIEIGAKELPTGILLGTAAFFSGSLWQPIVNLAHEAHFTFNPACALASVGCGLAFYTGLRVARALYNPIFPAGVEKASYANLKADAALALAIGGASGAFVGTDVTFGAANYLRPIVGVEETTSTIAGAVKAGLSTTIGFSTFQLVQNSVVPAGKNWVD